MSFDDTSEKVRVTKTHLETAKAFLDMVNEESGYAPLMRERRREYEDIQKAIRQAVRLLLNTKHASDGERRAAAAFVRQWNKVDFKIDSQNLRWSAYKEIEHLILGFVQQNIMVSDKDGSSRNLVMIPEFREALGEALKEAE
jgi:hypothetical protein